MILSPYQSNENRFLEETDGSVRRCSASAGRSPYGQMVQREIFLEHATGGEPDGVRWTPDTIDQAFQMKLPKALVS